MKYNPNSLFALSFCQVYRNNELYLLKDYELRHKEGVILTISNKDHRCFNYTCYWAHRHFNNHICQHTYTTKNIHWYQEFRNSNSYSIKPQTIQVNESVPSQWISCKRRRN